MSATYQFPPPHLIPENEDSKSTDAEDTPRGDTSKNADPDSKASQPQLALPAPESTTTATVATQQLPVSASDDGKHTIKFDHLGPLVLNKNGTLSRIHNWAQMTDAERERTVRVLGKRNMLRKEVILQEE